jgi:hypothetical protein
MQMEVDTLIQDLMRSTQASPDWSPEDTRESLEEMRRVHGDQWMLDNRQALENQLQEVMDFL